MEQAHLAGDAAMVALGGFLQPEKMRVELLLVEPAGAVDAREHSVLLVASLIRPRPPSPSASTGAELAGRRQIGAASQSRQGSAQGHSGAVRKAHGGRRT